MIKANLERVQARIASAASKVGRDLETIRLIAVTKEVPVERIREAVACGVEEIGENRVQEAQAKQVAIGRNVRWHLIGHLQRNKAKFAVKLFDVIHSVDSLELVEILGRRVEEDPSFTAIRRLDVLVQVNVSGEASKSGCRLEEVETLAEGLLQSRRLRLLGLMTMPPFTQDPESSRPIFRQLRELRDQLQKRVGDSPLDLSMGMSHDFEVAIEEGATIVRIGTAIFGAE